jgi:putative aldouronate transport system permease protein
MMVRINRRVQIKRDFKKNWNVYMIALPVIAFYVIFHYVPMGGVMIAFQKYVPSKGLFGSPWIGFENFSNFFNSIYCWRTISNTFILSLYDLAVGFPIPIVFALLLNEIRNKGYKRLVQTTTYMPFFISIVVVCGMISDAFKSSGPLSTIIASLGGPTGNLLGKPSMFRDIFVFTNLWQNLGANSIILVATLTTIDQQLYEAAKLDGANRFQKAIHVTLPGLIPTITILLILRIGNLLTVSFEKIILLYSPSTYSVSDVISSYVYRRGLEYMEFGYSTAVGLFNSLCNFTLLLLANTISRRFSDTSLF